MNLMCKLNLCMARHPRACLLLVITLLSLCAQQVKFCHARIHHLVLENEVRRSFPISTFGYFPGGSLVVQVGNLRMYPFDAQTETNMIGFTLAQTLSNNLSPYLEGRYTKHSCLLLEKMHNFPKEIGVITFKVDFVNKKLLLNCNSKLSHLPILDRQMVTGGQRRKRQEPVVYQDNHGRANKESKPRDPENLKAPLVQSNSAFANGESGLKDQVRADDNAELTLPDDRHDVDDGQENDQLSPDLTGQDQLPQLSVNAKSANISQVLPSVVKPAVKTVVDEAKIESLPMEPKREEVQFPKQSHQDLCSIDHLPLIQMDNSSNPGFSFQFQMYVHENYQGLYGLYVHNCLNYPNQNGQINFHSFDLDLKIVERNLDNYLSAGQMPLPQLYFSLAVIFFLLGTVWFYSLSSRNSDTFKIHYLMGVLVFVKALSLMFHSINYYFIAKEGAQVETWAVLYYVTHFLKGALMFVTIVLIGTGWTFIKHILSDKDKNIFMIVIPLQVIANIADIISEESEEGALIHTVWREIFILVDLLCCGAILFPVIWSIRHLQEASQTDGKAAISLKKLQLFRQFYVLVVFYIYFTRIIVYLIKITVPFQYEWLEALFQHAATLIFFIFTGHQFQPNNTNPYHQLLQQDDMEMDEEILFIQPNTFSEAKKRNRNLESSDVHLLMGSLPVSSSSRPEGSNDYA